MARRILLLDDEPDLLRALSVRFRAAGFTCETASNGREGLASVARGVPDLIVTDLIMPDVDGYELVRRLRADAATASVPIVVMSAMPKHELATQAKDLAVSCIMHKPFEFEELLSITRELLAQTPGGTPHE